jgi:LPPG:FO 2-phospho-L-lactate transferase
VVVLSGGVGGARMARAVAGVVPPERLTVIVNVGDDDFVYGVHVAADLDTVVYTLAGIEGPQGWGLTDDTFQVMAELVRRGLDTSFRLGDRDLATCLYRTEQLRNGTPLSEVTTSICRMLDLGTAILPATDDVLQTRVKVDSGEWLPFQEYFVRRSHRETVVELDYSNAAASTPAPGVLEAIQSSDLVIIAPSNPPLSIWPILAIPGIKAAVAASPRVAAISPLFGGKALKGPAHQVMASLGLPSGTAGILAAYDGLIDTLVVDSADSGDESLSTIATRIVSSNTMLVDPEAGRRFVEWLIDTMMQ